MPRPTTAMVTPDEERLCRAIQESPLFFFREILGANPTSEQIPIIEAFKTERRIAVKSGHSCGKDWLAARLALWFHVTHYPSIVVLTGPTDRQVRNIVWGEIKSAYRQARVPIGGEMLETVLKSGDPAHYMIGFTANSPESFQGFHSENVLVVVTEAPGVEPRMWPGIISILTAIGNARFIAIGNATFDPESEFYAMFTRSASIYRSFTLNSESSPYCSREWIDEMRSEHGVDSPVYQARVLGQFPTDIADTLVPLAWIERAYARFESYDPPNDAPLSLGCDIARFGSDLTCFYRSRGMRFEIDHVRQGQDLMTTAGEIASRINAGLPASNVRIDDTGLGGGVTDRLRELNHKITPINFGSKASDEIKFANARSEMFWLLRERFRAGEIALDPRDSKLLRDLSVLKYKLTSKGQIKLEEKAEAKHRLGYSPDRADALALASIPDAIAKLIASNTRTNLGIMEYMRELASKQKAKNEPVAKTPVVSLPEARALLEVSRDQSAPVARWNSLAE